VTPGGRYNRGMGETHGQVDVDVRVEGGRLAGVGIGRDFARLPEATLIAIGAALDGRPADLPAAALAAHVRAAIPFGVELRGTTPEAIAAAVRLAVTGYASERIGTFTSAEIDRLTGRWAEYPWRILPERLLPPELNVALDEVLTERLSKQLTPPTLRFWRWADPAVILGRTQSVVNEVDLEAAAARGVRVVRRMTGGGAMFVQPHGAITYSLTLPDSAVAGLSVRQSYEVCDAWAVACLRGLGVDAHHVPINDIACAAGKIGGAAQARRGGVVLHHTTLAYDMDPGEMASVLRIGRERLRAKSTASAPKFVSPLVWQTGLSRGEVVEALRAAFVARFGGTPSELTAEELAAAETLVATKYGTDAWTREFD
jgi:lipoate-protein ligase A